MNFKKLPIGTPIGDMGGGMFKEKVEWVPFDQLGLGITLYFKMVKVLIAILGIATLFCLPSIFVFSSGEEANTATGLDQMLGRYSLGNIGQSKDMSAS